jgi:hypothetical protein
MCDEKVRDKKEETGHAVSPGEAEENRGYFPSGQGIFGPRFEAGTPKYVLSRTVTPDFSVVDLYM